MKCTLLHFTVSFYMRLLPKCFGVLLVLSFQCLESKHYPGFYLVRHDPMGFYFLDGRYMTCFDVHIIVLQC